MLDFFYSFQPLDIARPTGSSVFLSPSYLALKTHLSAFAAFLPSIWQWRLSHSHWIYIFKVSSCNDQYDSMFHTVVHKTFGKNPRED